jgi:hypothetical protein
MPWLVRCSRSICWGRSNWTLPCPPSATSTANCFCASCSQCCSLCQPQGLRRHVFGKLMQVLDSDGFLLCNRVLSFRSNVSSPVTWHGRCGCVRIACTRIQYVPLPNCMWLTSRVAGCCLLVVCCLQRISTDPGVQVKASCAPSMQSWTRSLLLLFCVKGQESRLQTHVAPWLRPAWPAWAGC